MPYYGHHNYWEHEDRDGLEQQPPDCDRGWSRDCDNEGVYYLTPGHACRFCFSLCEDCKQREWKVQIGDRRLCAQCVPAAYAVSRPQGEAERHALVMAQMEGRR